MAADLPLEELSTTFARIQGLLLTEETVSKAVELLADAAKESIPGTLGAGVSLMDEQGRRTSWGGHRRDREAGGRPAIPAWRGTVHHGLGNNRDGAQQRLGRRGAVEPMESRGGRFGPAVGPERTAALQD